MLLLALGYLIAVRKQGQRLMSGLKSRRSGIQKNIGPFSPETARPQRIFLFFCAVVMGMALMLTASRFSLLSVALILALIGGLFFLKPGFRRYGWIAMVMGLVVLAGWSFVKNIPDAKKQTPGWCLPTSMMEDYAIAGVGPGNFEYIYPRYRRYDSENGPGNIGRPFLKILVEYGIPCSVLVFFAFGTLFYQLLRVWLRRKKDALATGLGAAAVGCMLTGGVSAIFGPGMWTGYVDRVCGPGMWTGYNCFLVVSIPALGYCALFRQGYGFSEKFFWKIQTLKLARWRRTLLLVPALAVWMMIINLTVENVSAEIFSAKDAVLASDSASKALPHKNGKNLEVKQAGDREFDKKTLSDLENTLRANPGSGENWYLLGKRYALQKQDVYQYLNKWLPLAEQCFEQGLKRLPCDADMLFDVAGYWVWRSGILADDSSRGKGIEKFQKLFKRSLAITPENWPAAAVMVWQYFPVDAVVMGIVPEGDGDLKSAVLKWTVLQERI